MIYEANDVELYAETFGEPGNPPLLLIGNSMLEWDGTCASCWQPATGW